MTVDVQTEIEIARSRQEVATYAADLDNTTAWYENIKHVEWKTSKPLAIGSKIGFRATFGGRQLSYTYEIKELVGGERLVMGTADGPFPMETTYGWEDTADGGTRMTLRNRGNPSGFARLGAPLLKQLMKRANRKDLERIKQILESTASQ